MPICLDRFLTVAKSREEGYFSFIDLVVSRLPLTRESRRKAHHYVVLNVTRERLRIKVTRRFCCRERKHHSGILASITIHQSRRRKVSGCRRNYLRPGDGGRSKHRQEWSEIALRCMPEVMLRGDDTGKSREQRAPLAACSITSWNSRPSLAG